jgi:hypothetical protein
MEKVWYAYLVNDSDFLIESVMVVSKAFGTIDGEMKKTSLLCVCRNTCRISCKIEMIEKSVLTLNNEFSVSILLKNCMIKIYFLKLILIQNLK